MKPRNRIKYPSAIAIKMASPHSQSRLSGIPAKLLAVPMICSAISSAQATILAYDGFGDALNNTTLNGYDGTSTELGFTGGWIVAGGTNNTVTPPVFGNQVGIVGGVTPETTGGAKHVVRKAQFNVGSLTRAFSGGNIDLTVDGTYCMSFFAAASGFDFVAQVGLSNATNELMAGQAYNGNRGLTAYYGTLNTSVTTNVNNTNLNAFNWADRNAFFTVQFTKTNSGTTNDVAVTITAYDLGNTVDGNISTFVEGTTKKTRTVNLTGVSASFDKLKVKLDGTVEFDEIRLGQTLNEVTTGGDSDLDGMADVWENLYFGNLSHDGTADGDADGLTDLQEYTAGANPTLADTDGDTINDGAEVSGTGNLFAPGTPTNPLLADSDGDKVSDYDEVHGTLNTSFSLAATNPNAADTDGDGSKDYKELVYHSNPNDSGNLPTPALFTLIDNTHQNGSFETKNGGVQITAKITKWDEVGNDIDNWTQMPGQVNVNDSGAEAANASNGSYSGYFQDGNSAYNLTTNVAAAGSVYAATWKQRTQGGNTITAKLVYKNASNVIVEIPGSAATTNTTGGVGDLVYQIPSGSPAIGFPIGISIGSTGYWIDVDEVALNIAATGDDDGDGLTNLWEVANGLNPNNAVGVNGALGDPDGDGYTNIDEQAAGSNPQLAASIPGDTDGDGLGDSWEIANFGSLSNPLGAPGADPDLDFDTNLVEFTNGTNPNNKSSYYTSTGDIVPDSWKTAFGIFAQTGDDDLDQGTGDGLPNWQEFSLATNPTLTDTDSDGLSDGNEVTVRFTNPRLVDTDGDGLTDGAEVNSWLTNPTLADTDADGYKDGAEVTAGSNPLDANSTPFNVGGGIVLIDPTHNNGSFETGTGKIASWGAVDFWDEWTGVSTATGDSGSDVSAAATQGTRVAFLQGNNAAYNMTTHVVAVGDIYTFQWDHVLRNSSNTVSLVWNNGGTITSIAASEVTSTTIGNGNGTSYEVHAGDPAIGSTIGLGLKNNNSNYPEVDNFILIVTPAAGAGDSDSDGMADSWETTYFGNLAQTATGDFDDDGTSNLTEFRLGLIPNSGASGFAATHSGAGLIQWPSVTGVTFRIERSTTLLGAWTTLESAFPGTAGTASYTDPSPPAGKAFYKVGLNP